MFAAIAQAAHGRQALVFSESPLIIVLDERPGGDWTLAYGIDPVTRSIKTLPSCFTPAQRVFDAIEEALANVR